MKGHFLGLFIIPLAIVVTSCRTLAPEKPIESYPIARQQARSSFIQVNIPLEGVVIQQIINRNFQGLLWADTLPDKDDDNFMMKIWKKDEIRLTIEENIIHWEAPLRVWLRTGFKIQKFGLNFSDSRELNTEILLKFSTRVELQPDWTVLTQTQSDGYAWLKSPTMKFSSYDIGITRLANILMQAGQQRLASAVDTLLMQELKIKFYASSLWNAIQQPIKINANPVVWLQMKPLGFYALPFHAQNNNIDYRLGISCILTALVNENPPYQDSVSLPALSFDFPQNRESIVHTRVEASMKTAEDLANQMLRGQKFKFGQKEFIVRSIKLYGSESKLAVEAQIGGEINGKLYFTGYPYYDTTTQSIRLRDFQFDLKTDNILKDIASWVKRTNIENSLYKLLVFDLSKQIAFLQDVFGSFLNELSRTNHIEINGKINSFSVDDIQISPEIITAYLTAKGEIGVRLLPSS
ncbi:MAG TPA: DUF4403 family protein [Bacteroidales bacterium]|jgi:hypothetical protein|nr:MAG: hypothetical protein BWX51_01586 [Bacteroidetes bacterium ADurb.Bin012]HNQ60339.1 DUF4403 family protein [Bacteroidales bacterium]HNU22033.1 DUF4403 family protein [Bacteroidales bacterium]HNV17583.1 DUF4403 family protein [Bacteroidales bacterium]HNZ79638.1 DUF4403 family protein [Bacteroidales bacterium]